jgi:hypothetical protein
MVYILHLADIVPEPDEKVRKKWRWRKWKAGRK